MAKKNEEPPVVVWRNATNRHITRDAQAEGNQATIMFKPGREIQLTETERAVRGTPPEGVIEERYDPKKHGPRRG